MIGCVQKIVASQPGAVPVVFEINEKYKQPFGDVEVKLGGNVAPE